ncbi:hypothetical protein Ciccas_008295 [Cichlidogyrus casuarinus]|uniref:Uncharacterized protein n=1 Tax=Cichlidogyrus casuarinus TaxID=1844966 RepID=A0ABD2Q2Z9_9PLAT
MKYTILFYFISVVYSYVIYRFNEPNNVPKLVAFDLAPIWHYHYPGIAFISSSLITDIDYNGYHDIFSSSPDGILIGKLNIDKPVSSKTLDSDNPSYWPVFQSNYHFFSSPVSFSYSPDAPKGVIFTSACGNLFLYNHEGILLNEYQIPSLYLSSNYRSQNHSKNPLDYLSLSRSPGKSDIELKPLVLSDPVVHITPVSHFARSDGISSLVQLDQSESVLIPVNYAEEVVPGNPLVTVLVRISRSALVPHLYDYLPEESKTYKFDPLEQDMRESREQAEMDLSAKCAIHILEVSQVDPLYRALITQPAFVSVPTKLDIVHPFEVMVSSGLGRMHKLTAKMVIKQAELFKQGGEFLEQYRVLLFPRGVTSWQLPPSYQGCNFVPLQQGLHCLYRDQADTVTLYETGTFKSVWQTDFSGGEQGTTDGATPTLLPVANAAQVVHLSTNGSLYLLQLHSGNVQAEYVLSESDKFTAAGQLTVFQDEAHNVWLLVVSDQGHLTAVRLLDGQLSRVNMINPEQVDAPVTKSYNLPQVVSTVHQKRVTNESSMQYEAVLDFVVTGASGDIMWLSSVVDEKDRTKSPVNSQHKVEKHRMLPVLTPKLRYVPFFGALDMQESPGVVHLNPLPSERNIVLNFEMTTYLPRDLPTGVEVEFWLLDGMKRLIVDPQTVKKAAKSDDLVVRVPVIFRVNSPGPWHGRLTLIAHNKATGLVHSLNIAINVHSNWKDQLLVALYWPIFVLVICLLFTEIVYTLDDKTKLKNVKHNHHEA